VAADRAADVRGITPRFGPAVGATVAIGFGLMGARKAASVGRWGLAITALSLACLALLLVRNLRRGIFRVLADAVVTFLPGPLTPVRCVD
jgi:hypothetical protein